MDKLLNHPVTEEKGEHANKLRGWLHEGLNSRYASHNSLMRCPSVNQTASEETLSASDTAVGQYQ